MLMGAVVFGMGLGVVGTAAPAGADLAPALFWCTAYKPHTGDNVNDAEWIFFDTQRAVARCAAGHFAQGPFGPYYDNHCYHVTVYADGSSAWLPAVCP